MSFPGTALAKILTIPIGTTLERYKGGDMTGIDIAVSLFAARNTPKSASVPSLTTGPVTLPMYMDLLGQSRT
jgi:hypothetical protein